MASKTLIRGGTVLSMDPAVGDFENADVVVEGTKITRIGPNLDPGPAVIIDAAGMIVMPGFIDTHHHQFETALRSFLSDALFFNDGKPHGAFNYVDFVLARFTQLYRPEDAYISELFGSLSQLDAGVTTVHDISQIHHSPEHTDAALKGILDSGRRAAVCYGSSFGNQPPDLRDVHRLRKQYFSSDDQLLTMTIGGEISQPGFEKAWALGRELSLPTVAHAVGGSMGMGKHFDQLAAAGQFGPDNLFIHMTGISDTGWRAARDAGAAISLAVPIEMSMRLGMSPLLKSIEMGIQPSLSSDVECTMSADFFTQMRSALTLQRALVNEAALSGEEGLPELLTSRDVIRFATVEGAGALKLDGKIGTLTPGKEADIILLDATAINVAPLNHVPGAVVTLMDRSNVDTVLVAGKVRKRRGRLLDVDLPRLRRELEQSRDYLFRAAGVEQDLFRR